MPLPDNPTLLFLIQYGYWIAIPLMIFEGPIVTVVMAFFASFGYFHPLGVFAIGVAADLISDSFFYALGYFGGDKFVNRFGKYFRLSAQAFPVVTKFYEKHGGKSAFLAKTLPGLVPPIFIMAGYSKMSLRKLYFFAVLGGVVWSAALVALGYFLGRQLGGDFDNLGRLFSRTGYILFSVLAFFIIYRFYLHKVVERKLTLVWNGFKNQRGGKGE